MSRRVRLPSSAASDRWRAGDDLYNADLRPMQVPDSREAPLLASHSALSLGSLLQVPLFWKKREKHEGADEDLTPLFFALQKFRAPAMVIHDTVACQKKP